jgi:type I restriction enzyme S subunit
VFISNEKAQSLIYHSFESGDIILAKLGDVLGKSCIVPGKYSFGIVVGDVIRIRVPEKACNKQFLLSFLNSNSCEKFLSKQVIGATRPRVNLNNVREIPMPYPPIELQNEFEKRVKLIQSIKEKQQSSTQEINTLFDALMQKAFKGELA